MYQFLTSDNCFSRFEQSKIYTDSLTTRFPEFHRIASNQPKSGMPEHLPKNTDGTTASIVHKTGRRVVQQLPTGIVKGTQDEWLTIVGGFIFTELIIKNANSQYELIEKCWQMIEGTLIRGFSCWYSPLVSKGDYVGPDLVLPYWGDVYIQPGKLSDKDANYIFLRSWWREEDIDALIDRVGKMDKSDAEESGWDVEVLRKIKDHEQTKDDKAQTPTDRAQAVNQRGGIELITGFQRGVGSKFLTFHRETKTVARTKENLDPRGEMPLGFMYCETDGTNPFGRGFVEVVAPLQNLMDSDDQMYQFNRALMLAPPVIKRGNWNKTQAQLIPNAIWDMGTNQANTAEVLKIDSSALVNYPQLYQLNQSRIFQLLSAPTTNIPANTGTVGSSKTTAGVNQTNATLSVDDNFIRRKFEAAFQEWGESAINQWFAEHTGTEELQLDVDTANRLRNLNGFDTAMLSDDNKIRINYDDETPALSFNIDASTSKKADDAEQVQIYQNAAQLFTPQVTWFLGQDGWKFDMGTYYRNMLSRMHMEDIDKVLTKMTDEEAQQAKSQPFPIVDPPQFRINSADLPPEALAAVLQNGGVNMPQGVNMQKDKSIDPAEIYKDTTTPIEAKLQILQKAGIQLSPETIAEMQATEASTHMVNQVGNMAQTADHIMGQPPQETAPQSATDSQQPAQQTQPPTDEGPTEEPGEAQLDPEDMQVIEHLEVLGVPEDKINEAITLLKQGEPAEVVLQQLGITNAA